MSTAYVNCDKLGWIEEKIYPISRDPEVVLKELLNIPESDVEAITP